MRQEARALCSRLKSFQRSFLGSEINKQAKDMITFFFVGILPTNPVKWKQRSYLDYELILDLRHETVAASWNELHYVSQWRKANLPFPHSSASLCHL